MCSSDLTGTEPSGTYLRRPDEAQSWLASGGVQIDQAVAGWLDDEIVDIHPEAIRRIVIERAGEPGYGAAREEPAGDLRLTGLAADEALKEDADLTRLTGALAGVRLEDVKPRAQLNWPAQQHTARIETFDGVELTVRLARIDDEYWATFDAHAVAPTPGAASAAAQAKPDAAAGAEPGAPDDGAAAGQESAGSVADDRTAEGKQDQSGGAGGLEEVALDEPAAQEAAAPIDPDKLNQRLRKWAYRIPEYLFNRLSTARSELVEDRDGTS